MNYLKNTTIDIISGYITIDNVDRFINHLQEFASDEIIIQVFNAEMIFGKDHLLSAVHHALRAEKQGRLITHSLSMELLLYASGERQLKHAIPKMGVKKGKNSISILIIQRKNLKTTVVDTIQKELKIMFSFKSDPQIIIPNLDFLHAFGITDEEIQTIPEDKFQHLVLEKVALVDIIK